MVYPFKRSHWHKLSTALVGHFFLSFFLHFSLSPLFLLHSFMHPFIRLSIHSFLFSFSLKIRPFCIHSFIYSVIRSFVRSFIIYLSIYFPFFSSFPLSKETCPSSAWTREPLCESKQHIACARTHPRRTPSRLLCPRKALILSIYDNAITVFILFGCRFAFCYIWRGCNVLIMSWKVCIVR